MVIIVPSYQEKLSDETFVGIFGCRTGLGGKDHLWVGLGHKWTIVNTMIRDMSTKIGVGKIDVSNQLTVGQVEN